MKVLYGCLIVMAPLMRPQAHLMDGLVAKLLRMTAREYNSSYQMQLHNNTWWDGSGASGTEQLGEPILTITAYAWVTYGKEKSKTHQNKVRVVYRGERFPGVNKSKRAPASSKRRCNLQKRHV